MTKEELAILEKAIRACQGEWIEHVPYGDNTYNEAVNDCIAAIRRLKDETV